MANNIALISVEDLRGRGNALLARLLTVTRRHEDLLTEAFAALLQSDQRLARSYVSLLVGRVSNSEPVRVVTQQSARDPRCRLDMLIVAKPWRIAVEHKLTAPQGRGQLEKYISVRRSAVNRVALVAAAVQPVAGRVMRHPYYLRPRGGQNHFFWADMWPIIIAAYKLRAPLAPHVHSLFIALGLHPPHKLIGNLRGPDAKLVSRNDKRLDEAWKPLDRALRRRRWDWERTTLTTRCQSQRYIFPRSSILKQVWIDPHSSPSTLLVRLKSHSKKDADSMKERLDNRRDSYPFGRCIDAQRDYRSDNRFPHTIDVRIPWQVLLQRCRSQRAVSRTLARFVLGLMDAAR